MSPGRWGSISLLLEAEEERAEAFVARYAPRSGWVCETCRRCFDSDVALSNHLAKRHGRRRARR